MLYTNFAHDPQAQDFAPVELCLASDPRKYRHRGIFTAELVRAMLRYDPETGLFTWKVTDRGVNKIGKIAGSKLNGYWSIQYKGKRFSAHRLAYLWMMGKDADGEIDHIDGEQLNNRWSNLRLATHAQNTRNTRKLSPASSGYKGVYSYEDHVRPNHKKRHSASINLNKKRIFLGYFYTAEEAYAAYCTAATKYHGEFARVS